MPGGVQVQTGADVTQPRVLNDIVQYWRALRPLELVPSRHDIKPTSIPRLLPYIALMDVITREPLSLRYRLVGTGIARIFGRDLTNHDVREAFPEAVWREVEHDLRRAIIDGMMTTRIHRLAVAGGESALFARIALPLATDHRTVDALMIGLAPVDERDAPWPYRPAPGP
jgi:hypothetical protein